MRPRAERGWFQLGAGVLLIVLLVLAAFDVQRSAVLASISFLAIVVLVANIRDEDQHEAFRMLLLRHRISVQPGLVFLAICLFALVLWALLDFLGSR